MKIPPLIFRLTCFIVWVASASAAVVAGELSPRDGTTIIDILSNFAQYSILMGHIRRHGLVPMINMSRNATLVAPVNSAFAQIPNDHITKDLLLYHLIDGTILSDHIDNGDSIWPSYLKVGSANDKNERVPVRVSRTEGNDLYINSNKVVEKDLKAGAYRGAVQATDTLLTVPKDVCETLVDLYANEFLEILKLDYDCESTERSTILVPSHSAFEQTFSSVEMKYLFHDQGVEDRTKILNRHIIPGQILPSTSFTTENVSTLDGQKLQIGSGSIINGTFRPVKTNVLTRNGIIHVYDHLVQEIDEPIVEYTPEKYLYGLKADQFVKELRFQDMDYLINGETTSPQTIFVPSSITNNDEVRAESMLSLLYHFMEQQYHLAWMIDERFLMKSKMITKKLNFHNQRVKAVSSASGAVYLNGHEVISREHMVGNTSIYFIEDDLDVPPSLSLAVGPFFQNSYSVSFLERLQLLYPPRGVAWTVFLPTRDAWQKQGLITRYLSDNSTALELVMKSMIFYTPFYTDSPPREVEFLDGSVKNVTSEGYDDTKVPTEIIHVGNDALHLNAPDILFESGVAHSIDNLVIPQTVDIQAEDLIRAGNREMFIDLLVARNMSYVLDPNAGYTLLVPSPPSLQKHNITADSEDIDLLLSMHILPDNPIQQLLSEQKVDTMAEGVALKARDISDGLYFIQIVGGADHELHILNRGDTTSANGTTVLFIDRHLRPEWVANPLLPPFHPHDPHLKTPIAIMLGVVGGAILIFCIISTALYFYLWSSKTKGNESDPLLSGSDSDEDYGTSEHNNQQIGQRQSRSRNHSRRNSQQYYPTIEENVAQEDDNTKHRSAPIKTTKVQANREFGRHLNLPGQPYL